MQYASARMLLISEDQMRAFGCITSDVYSGAQSAHYSERPGGSGGIPCTTSYWGKSVWGGGGVRSGIRSFISDSCDSFEWRPYGAFEIEAPYQIFSTFDMRSPERIHSFGKPE